MPIPARLPAGRNKSEGGVGAGARWAGQIQIRWLKPVVMVVAGSPMTVVPVAVAARPAHLIAGPNPAPAAPKRPAAAPKPETRNAPEQALPEWCQKIEERSARMKSEIEAAINKAAAGGKTACGGARQARRR